MAKLNITQVKSRIGATQIQKKNLAALGLRKINQTVTHEDSPVIMGMLERVKHLVNIEAGAEVKASKVSRSAAARAEKAPKAEVVKETTEEKASKTPKAETEAAEEQTVNPVTSTKDESK